MSYKPTQPTENIWFPGQQEPTLDEQDEQSIDFFKAYWRQERQRCIDGFDLADGQVHVPGRLYFHTVYWKIARYVEIPGKSNKARIIATPSLRDIDWDIFCDLDKCQEEGRFYTLVTARDLGKSIISGSCAGHLYTFYNNSESIISAGAENYIKVVTDKVEEGLTNMHPIFKKTRITTDWKKEVRAGWKDKKTNQIDEKSSNSHILMINYRAGSNTMAANGTRPGFHVIDEIGTLPNLIGCVKDSDGCWWSGGGSKPSALVVLSGTGGSMEVGAEAAEIFYAPYAYNMLEFENTWEDGGRIGRFIPATRGRMKYKYPKSLGQYLNIDHPDLNKVIILVSDEEETYKDWWEPEYKRALKSGNSKTLLKFKAYWPIKPSDSFTVLSQNDYNVDAARLQQTKIRDAGITGTPIELVYDGDKIVHKISNKLPITQYPLKDQEKDAPIIMWEPPIKDPPFSLYVAGIDPYRQDSTEWGDSLGAVYIYKRIHDINSEYHQDTFVASYVARPESVDKWCENARMLIKYYNAMGLCENDDMTFIRYMLNKGDGHYLVDQPQWLKEIVPNTKVQREKGIHRSSLQIRNFLRGCLKQYLDDTIRTDKNEDGSIAREVLGVSKILDPMLLEEIIKYDGVRNVDRIVAAELAVAMANKLSPMGKVSSVDTDPRFMSLFNKDKPRSGSLFGRSTTMFNNKRKNKLFL